MYFFTTASITTKKPANDLPTILALILNDKIQTLNSSEVLSKNTTIDDDKHILDEDQKQDQELYFPPTIELSPTTFALSRFMSVADCKDDLSLNILVSILAHQVKEDYLENYSIQ